MQAPASYQVVDRIERRRRGDLLRASNDGRSVLLKKAYGNALMQAGQRLERELEVLRKLRGRGAVLDAQGLESVDGVPTLVLEDFAGSALTTLLGQPLEAPRLLTLAIAISRAVETMHRCNFAHRDLEPENILVDARGHVKLIELGRASTDASEEPPGPPASETDGSPAYMSPEQTGRMNRVVDARTDLYSLGVTFYQMLTGRLPFEAKDTLEWVHAHLARSPEDPSEIVHGIPRPLAEIVLKLLSKAAEDRYQSTRGLVADLEECAARLNAAGTIEPFVLGTHDVSERFQVPQKLYGREAEVAALLDAFERVAASGRSALALVSGYAGVGKSSLIGELQKPVLGKRGYFTSGKFEQHKTDIPFSTIASAFRALIREVLSESDERIAAYGRELEQALGENGQIVVDLIPQLGLFLLPQAPVPELPPLEAQHRFRTVFCRMIGVFARKEHPLALFLDDLQWADPASLALLKELVVHPEAGFLLVVGAYRDNEVTPDHPLRRVLEEAKKGGAEITCVTLRPLSHEHLVALVSDTLRCGRREAAPLADLLLEKTAGNPFFAMQFLTAIHEERLIEFDAKTRTWRWDVPKIRAKGFTDNLVDLMIAKLKRLSRASQDALTRMACLGSVAQIETIARILGRSEEHAHADLADAASAGLVLRQGNAYKFLHDRVQEAAYSLLGPAERAALHLKIGRAVASSGALTEENLFDVVNQLNRAAELMTAPAERLQTAELNLRAGRKAKASTAYAAAAAHFAAGRALLTDDAWTTDHELAFMLHIGSAECAHATFDFAENGRICQILASRAESPLEKARVCNLNVDAYTAQGDFPRALASGIASVRLLGIDLLEDPTPEDVHKEENLVWDLLGERPIEALLDLPAMTNPEMFTAMDTLAAIHPAAYFLGKEGLFQSIPCCMTHISIRHGNAPASAMAYGQFATFLVYARARYGDALRLATVGCSLADRPSGIAHRSKAYFAMGANICPYTRPVPIALQFLDKCVDASRQAGDPTFIVFSLINRAYLLLHEGRSLKDAERESARTVDFVTTSRMHALLPLVLSTQRLTFALRGGTARVASLGGDDFCESEFDERLRKPLVPGIVFCWFHACRLQSRYLGGEYLAALESAGELDGRESVIACNPIRLDYEFYTPLALTALFGTAEIPRLRERLERHLYQLELYARSCPETFANRHALVAAEVARIERRELDAQRLYEAAIRSASENGLTQNEGLARDLAARFYRARGYETIADAYVREARVCFARAGADGLVKQLDGNFPHLKPPAGAPAAHVDVIAVVKASQAISGKLVLDDLLDTLMRTVLENAGAQKGWLVLLRNDEVTAAAEARADQEKVSVQIHPSPASFEKSVPQSLLNYVRRSHERVLLSNAASQNAFSRDDYFTREKPKSVLCIPILRKNVPLALLYLENNLVTDAFTVDRLAVLEILASQAAISVETSLLYEALAQENAERKRAEQAVRESKNLLQGIIDNSTAVIFAKDLEGRYILVNRRVYEVFYPLGGSLLGKTAFDLFPSERAAELRAHDLRAVETGGVVEWEETVPSTSGPRTYLSLRFPLRDAKGEIFAICGIGTDITERKRLEEQFIQAQKMESVGRLAGGVAHDFNNILTAILGYAEVVRARVDSKDVADDVEQIRLAAVRAARLTRQLLIFARRNVVELEVLDIRQVVEELSHLLRRLIGEDVELVMRPSGDEWPVRADAGQLEQVLVNLAVNARDAMPSGGRLTIEMRNVEMDEATQQRHLTLSPGQYVQLSVSDTGTGMTEEAKAHLFEPFFTTKEKGKGTGLGLATCYGIVQQCGGQIFCYSEPGGGTTFKIFLPRFLGAPRTVEVVRREATVPEGSETVLVVEDDTSVRTIAVRALRARGYRVLEAANGKAAIRVAEKETAIDLLVTDLVMPEMGGRELADKMRALRRGLRVLFTSGYTDDVAALQGALGSGEAFLQKPFTASSIAIRVRHVLTEPV